MKKILNPKIALSLPMERYIAYLFDIVIVISITSVILSIFHFKPYIYLIFVYYRTNHHKILSLNLCLSFDLNINNESIIAKGMNILIIDLSNFFS